MSREIELAKECGFYVDEEDGSVWDHNDPIEQDGCGMMDISDKLSDFYQRAFNDGQLAMRERASVISRHYGAISEDIRKLEIE